MKKLLGPRAAWLDSGGMTTPELRAQKTQERRAAHLLTETAKAAAAKRREELLADPEYQRLIQARRDAYAAEQSIRGGGYRITVGVNAGIGLLVRGEGDNWADVIKALEAQDKNDHTVARVS